MHQLETPAYRAARALADRLHAGQVDKVGIPYTASLSHLRTAQPPPPVHHPRWLQFLAERLVTERGAELEAAGWDDLDVFAIQAVAPMVRVDGGSTALLPRRTFPCYGEA